MINFISSYSDIIFLVSSFCFIIVMISHASKGKRPRFRSETKNNSSHGWRSPGHIKPYAATIYAAPSKPHFFHRFRLPEHSSSHDANPGSNAASTIKAFRLNTSLLTIKEAEFHALLIAALNGQPYLIAIKPRVADFISITHNRHHDAKEFHSCFDKINAKYVDFLICDMTYRPLLAVVLVDVTRFRPDRMDSDELVEVYRTAGLPVLHTDDYSFDSLENKLSNLLPAYQHATRPSAAG